MSAIDTYLNYIATKIWARDVRTAIVNAIQQCYNDVNSPTLLTEGIESILEDMVDNGRISLAIMDDLGLITEGTNNLFDFSKVTAGRLNTSTGEVGEASGYWTSDFIPVENGKTYYFANTDRRVAYNSSKAYSANISGTTWTAQADGYVRVSVTSANRKTAKINEGSSKAYRPGRAPVDYNLRDDVYRKAEVDAALAAVTIATDPELETAGAAADAKATGDAISALNESLGDMRTATGSDIGKVLTVKSVTNNKVSEWEFTTPESGGGESGDGLSDAIKTAILNCFEHVAWTDNQGQTYYDELEELLFPTGTLTGISVTYSNQSPVPEGTTLNDLKQYLTVVAYYSGGTSETVNAYTLSGTLTTGTCQVTVTYQGKTARFNVQVAVTPKSDMNGWTDGIAYTDLEIVENSYYTTTGGIASYNNWNRTGMVPCDGATSITFKANGSSNMSKDFCWFFDENETKTQKFDTALSKDTDVTVTVPSGAYFFGISAAATHLTAQINAGIIPNA